LNSIAAEESINIDAVTPVDDDAQAIYQYLIGSEGGAS
jgi:ABC-2 type transport system ATP-binding protein